MMLKEIKLMKIQRVNKQLSAIAAGMIFLLLSIPVWAQTEQDLQLQIRQLENRIQNLENILQSQQHQIEDFTQSFQRNFERYTQELEGSLNEYTERLQLNLNEKILTNTFRSITLNPISKEYKRIDTVSGTFIIVVDKIERTASGYRLKTSIGNPNMAYFRGIELKLRWGTKRDPKAWRTYEEWERTLQSAKFTYDLELPAGEWRQIVTDLSPVKIEELEYIECSMEVNSVELELKDK